MAARRNMSPPSTMPSPRAMKISSLRRARGRRCGRGSDRALRSEAHGACVERDRSSNPNWQSLFAVCNCLSIDPYLSSGSEIGMERRLAAILAADVAGYSRMMGADEVGTLARMTALRREVLEPLIARFRGRIVKLMGDGFLLEFASLVDAVQCAT